MQMVDSANETQPTKWPGAGRLLREPPKNGL